MGSKRESNDEEMSTSDSTPNDDISEEKKQAESESGEDGSGTGLMPFMDTFYSLSSHDPSERSIAASSLLSHVFLSSADGNGGSNVDVDSIVKDGFYALSRLLNGLCSGRASARQGFASCLATFLKLSFKLGPEEGKCWMDCFMDHHASTTESKQDEEKDDEEERAYASPTEFVRFKMLESCSSSRNMSKRKKSGSEERDYNFGQLFGILAVVRSGILSKDAKVIQGYIQDLLDLYHHKGWMREPSIRALQELFSFIAHYSFESLHDLVQDTLDDFFTHDATDSSNDSGWTAEKITLYLHLQTLYMDQMDDAHELPKALSEPVLTISALKQRDDTDDGSDDQKCLTTTLRDTSKVVHPRCHLVWDAIWSYLTVSPSSKRQKGKKQNDAGAFSYKGHTLRESLIVGDEKPEEIMTVVINQVIVHGLLGANSNAGEENDDDVQMDSQTEENNATHERRALALSLLNQLCPMNLPEDVMESVLLQPVIVTKLFIKTLQKGGKNNHILQPLALTILNDILASVNAESAEKKMVIIRSMLRAHPAFDSITRTRTVASLLALDQKTSSVGLDDADTKDKNQSGRNVKDCKALWIQYLAFLQKKVLEYSAPGQNTSDGLSKYIDLMLELAKQMARLTEKDIGDSLCKRVLSFFFIGGFFNIQDMKLKAKKKKKKTDDCLEALEVSTLIKEQLTQDNGTVNLIPLPLRTLLSAKFHSLLADMTSIISRGADSEQSESKTDRCLSVFAFVRSAWETLEKHGAFAFCKVPLQGQQVDDDSSNDSLTAEYLKSAEICSAVISRAQTSAESGNSVDGAKKKAITGISCLIISLHLQLLHPGEPESFDDVNMDDDDDDEGDIREEVNDMISGLSDILAELEETDTSAPTKSGTANDGEDEEDNEEMNSLGTLAAMCVNLLNSSLGGSGVSLYRAGGTKLVRDCVKLAWTGGLFYASKVSSDENRSEKFSLDMNGMNLLLESICGEDSMEDEDEDMDDEDELDDAIPMDLDDGSSSNESDEDGDSDDESSNDKADDGKDAAAIEEEEDLELDPSKLESLLLEDVDSDDENELEHHEGADAALAQLIKIKQEARKAGRTKRERTELANRLRCVMLLEMVFTSSHIKSSLLSNQTILMSILPLLRTTRQLHKSIVRVLEGRDHSSIGDRRALVEKITNLLQTKISKSNLNGSANMESCETVAENVKVELKKVKDAKYITCCSSLLALTVKAVSQNFENSVKLAETVYAEAVEDWSQKKNSVYTVPIFNDFIQRCPRVARAVMVEPLLAATKEARSSFLRVEAFDILSSLYNTSKQESVLPEEIKSLQEAIPSISESVGVALTDTDMIKSKRFRSLLQSIEMVSKFASNNTTSTLMKSLNELSEPLKAICEDSPSEPVKNFCSNIVENINAGLEKLKQEEAENEKKNSTSSSSKKKKKKKGKGKKK